MGYADGKYSWMGYKVQLLETGQFENGLREGKVTEFYNGCVFIEYNFHKGIDTSRTYHLYHSIDSGRCVKKQSIMNFDFKNKKELLQFFDTSGKELKRAEMELKYGHMPNDPKNTQGNWYQYLSYVYRDTVPESRIKNCDGKSELKFIKNGMIHIQKGEFRNCNFINGDIWIYDKNGLLLKIMVYKDGKYVGDKMLPENEKK